MSLIAKLKKLPFKRPFVIALSIAVPPVVGFGLDLHLPAILFASLLFACGYLLEPTQDGN